MNTLYSRIASLALVAITLAFSLVAIPHPAAASDDFVMVYFPHEDVTSHFFNDFGNTRSGGRRHQGTDIFAAKGSPIVAVADGFVTKIATGDRSGYHVRIEHAGGWETWYMHLNNDTPGTDDGNGGPTAAFAVDLEVGMYVPAGTVIGYVGDSGNAEGSTSHTHFELHDGRGVVNPYPYLAAAHDRWLRFMDLENEVR